MGSEQDTAKLTIGLSVVLRRLRSRLREEAGATSTGLTLSQLALIARLDDGGPATAASLAVSQHVSQQAVAQSLALLKSAGLVAVTPHPTDGRKQLIDLTPTGRALYRRLEESRETWLARAIDAVMSPQDREVLAAAVELMNRLADADLSPELDIK